MDKKEAEPTPPKTARYRVILDRRRPQKTDGIAWLGVIETKQPGAGH